MAKKKRRGNSGPCNKLNDDASTTSAIAGSPAPPETGSTDNKESGGAAAGAAADLSLVLRAVSWLGANYKAGRLVTQRPADEMVLEVVQPLILARAAKYQDDSKAALLANAGKHSASNKRPHGAMSNSELAFKSGSIRDPLKDEDIGPAIKALRKLAESPDLLLGKECKQLRAALHPLVEAHIRQENASPAFRVTCMLGQRSRWSQVLPLLAGMRTAEPHRRPKLGAYMRWVRELNVADGDAQELAMLDAIMRTAGGLPLSTAPSPTAGSLKEFPAFRAPSKDAKSADPRTSSAASSSKMPVYSYAPGAFSIIAHESALERKPPNHFDLDIFACAPGVIAFDAAPAREVSRQAVPGVAGAFVLTDVLSSS